MKRKLSTFLVMALLGARAQADMGAADVPRLYPDCVRNALLVMPNDSEALTHFWSRDCRVAYVMPPSVGEVEINKPAPINLERCAAVDKVNKQILALEDQTLKLIDSLDGMPIGDNRRQQVLDQIAVLQGVKSKTEATYGALAGLAFQMTFKNDLSPERMMKLRNANMQAIEDGRLKIRPVTLAQSYISFNSFIPGTSKTYAGNPILDSNILGILNRADEGKDRSSVRFDGAASGYVVLNLFASCPLVKKDPKTEEWVVKKETASNFLIATQTMQVGLLTSFGYSAALNVENLTKILFDKFGRKGQFSAREFSNLLLSGDISNMFSFSNWTYEEPTGEAKVISEGMMSIEQKNAVKADLLVQYAEALVASKFIKEITPLDTPNAGNEVRTGTRRECWSSSFLGFQVDRGCRDVEFQFLVPTDGTSAQHVEIANQVRARLSETVEVLRPTNKTFTAAFKVK